MKIGLLLGSFNPITVAHISMASAVINSKLCDKVLFVVAKHNPWKEEMPAPFDVRCQMVKAAIKPFGKSCDVCRVEEEIDGTAYSYLTINKILEKYPNDELYLIGGTDTIENIPKWKNFETHIKDKIRFIEIERPTVGKQHSNLLGVDIPFRKWLRSRDELWKGFIDFVQIKRMDVSSTMVRKMIKEDMNPCPYVTENVYKIIKANKLYK